MLSPDTLHHEEVNLALDRQVRQDIQDMAQEAQIQAQIIAHEGKKILKLYVFNKYTVLLCYQKRFASIFKAFCERQLR